jgi:hypothetical protein
MDGWAQDYCLWLRIAVDDMTRLEQFNNLIWKARRRDDQYEVDHLNELWDEALEVVKAESVGTWSYEEVADIALKKAKGLDKTLKV